MSALFAGHAASTVVLGFSPWLIPLIAVAAKLTHDKARRLFGTEIPRSGDRGRRRREPRPRNQPVMHERIKARLEATIWPE
jgi:hypothetical protein